jgi:group II intron reverse transcriptase/maturase
VGGQKSPNKSFEIAKAEVWQAWEVVRANKGAAGVDGVSIEAFEQDLRNQLYKIWNRMSSGTYFPPAVKAVEIPKPHGDGVRVLGIPTVADRVAQTVVARRLEARVESIFHPDSYGYRPERSAHDAVRVCRQRCWKFDWVLDLDIEKFFDTVDHDLMLKAVAANTDQPWVVLYVRRWLAAPVAQPDGTVTARDRGTPQGSAVSPVLANLFLHYGFDTWMAREYPNVPFERYVDDAVVHCVSEEQAQQLRRAIGDRLEGVGLRLHPTKTRIVYCRDGNRRRDYAHTAFTFLGFTFRARKARNHRTGVNFTGFLPAVSLEALKRMGRQLRDWRLHRRTGSTTKQLADLINPVVRGWMQYYGAFYPTALRGLLRRINTYLLRWLRNKFERLRAIRKARRAWGRVVDQYPRLFTHWQVERTFR